MTQRVRNGDTTLAFIDTELQEDFTRARRQAFIARMWALLHGQTHDLIPFAELRARLHVHGQRGLGHQTVPVDRIIGSEGRYSDFDRSFAPRHEQTKYRWISINRAYYEDRHLPPVDLYKVGSMYFVKDGNHRVSVARQRRQIEIDAFVTEVLVNVPLPPDLHIRDVLIMEEYSDFLEWTNLHCLRPEQQIVFSVLGGYLDLIKHINTHRYFITQEQGTCMSRDAAVISWYDHVYMPVVQVVRAQDVLRHFPGRTEADLYRWIMDHRWYMREHNDGIDPGAYAATTAYVARFGRKRLIEITERLLRRALGALRAGS
mgnify:CR=1 FL=1